jgi:hypothetical protein
VSEAICKGCGNSGTGIDGNPCPCKLDAAGRFYFERSVEYARQLRQAREALATLLLCREVLASERAIGPLERQNLLRQIDQAVAACG